MEPALHERKDRIGENKEEKGGGKQRKADIRLRQHSANG